MTTRIPVVLVVTLLSACGARARPAASSADQRASRAETIVAVPESNTADDYVVGPFVTSPEDGEAGVTTYYIVRN